MCRRPYAVIFLVLKQYPSTLKYLRYSMRCMRLIDLLPEACRNMIKVYDLFTKLNSKLHVDPFFHLFMHHDITYTCVQNHHQNNFPCQHSNVSWHTALSRLNITIDGSITSTAIYWRATELI